MKKKLKDITFDEMIDICTKYTLGKARDKYCSSECPFYIDLCNFRCTDYYRETHPDEEVEISEV